MPHEKKRSGEKAGYTTFIFHQNHLELFRIVVQHIQLY
jgi:hypothetical protein